MILSESSGKVCVNIYFIGFQDGESAAPAEILLTKCPKTTSTCPRVHLKVKRENGGAPAGLTPARIVFNQRAAAR